MTDTTPLQTTYMDAMGFIDVSQAGVYTFSMPFADDATRILIGGSGTMGSGTDVLEQNFYNTLSSGSAAVTFGAPGLYPFEIFYMNQYYGTGQGGANLNFSVSPPLGGSVAYFQSVGTPEPSSVVLVGSGAIALGAMALQRRMQKQAGER